MNEFEFLRNMPFGQYIPGDSFIHRLDPRARIAALFCLLTAVTFSARPLGLALGLVVILIGLILSKSSLGYALRGLLTPLPFLLILALLQVLFNALPDTGLVLFKVWRVTITPNDLQAGGMLLLRFATLVLGISFATLILSTSEMTHGLESLLSPAAKIGLPVHDFVIVLQVTVRFLPFLAQAAERIAKAQAARGASSDNRKGGLLKRARQVVPLLVPLFVISLRRAETMALAMDARGYASRTRHTSLVEMHFRPLDGVLVLGIMILSGFVFWV